MSNQVKQTVSSAIDRLVSVVFGIGKLNTLISDVCVEEIRLKVDVLGWTVERSADCEKVEALKELQAQERDFNEGRMKAFISEITKDKYIGDLALLSWHDSKKSGKPEANCNVYRLRDDSNETTRMYSAVYGGNYANMKSAFFKEWLVNPEEALKALYSKDAVQAIQRFKDMQAEASTAGKSNSAGGNETQAVELPADAADELREFFNTCDSLKRVARDAVNANPDCIVHLPAIAEALRKFVPQIAKVAQVEVKAA